MDYVKELRKLIGTRPIILVGAVVIIIDDLGRILLQQRTYPKGKWGLPGGLMELGETTEETARREVLEETGLTVDQLNLLNVYSGPEHFSIAENGDEFFMVTIAYYTNCYKGKMDVDLSESIQCKFFYPTDIPEYMLKSHYQIVREFLLKKSLTNT